jgi:hypothetical protein
MSQDAFLMQQMLSTLMGGGRDWLEAAFLLGLFAAALFKRQHIHNVALFRRSFYIFGLSILVPPCLVLLLAYAMSGFAPGSPGLSGGPRGALSVSLGSTLLGPIIAAVGPVLLAISIICAFLALVPTFIPPELPPLPGPRGRSGWTPSGLPGEPTPSENEG